MKLFKMFSAFDVTNPRLRTAKVARLIAKGIDLFVVMIMSMTFHPFGVFLALSYLAFSDSLYHGQSFGKKMIGFQVVSLINGRPCTFKQSVLRNLPFMVPVALMIIPFWGTIFCILLAIPLMSFEAYLIWWMNPGHRVGDVMADTTVVSLIGGILVESKLKKDGPWFSSVPH